MIKLALIGCGKWGKHYLKTLTSIKGCELRWVCDLDPHLKVIFVWQGNL